MGARQRRRLLQEVLLGTLNKKSGGRDTPHFSAARSRLLGADFMQNIQIQQFFRDLFVHYAENKKSRKYFNLPIDKMLGLCYNIYVRKR